MDDLKKCIIETKYEKIKKLNTIIVLPLIFFMLLVMIVAGYAIDINLGEKWANIIVLSMAGLFFIFLAIYLPIFLIKMRKERIEYAKFYKNLNLESFFTKLDNVAFTDDAGQKIKFFQIDRKGFRASPIDINWNDFYIKVKENYTNNIKLMYLVFVSKNDDSYFFYVTPTYKNFYIIKNYSGQEIENIDELENYVEKASYINRL